MKFVLEALDTGYIARRVVEEQARTGGRRVTRVELSPPEWAEFKMNYLGSGDYRYNIGELQSVRVAIYKPFAGHVVDSDVAVANPDIQTVDVVLGLP